MEDRRKKMLERYPDRLFAKNESNSSEWFGAIAVYLFGLGRTPFSAIYTPERFKRNKWIGRLVKLVLYLIIGGLIVWWFFFTT